MSVNLARPGDTSADVRTEVGDGAVRADLRRATVVLIMVGANDLAAAFAGGQRRRGLPGVGRGRAGERGGHSGRRGRAHGTPVTVLVLGYWNVVKDGAAGLAAYGADRAGFGAVRHALLQSGATAGGAQTGARYVPTTTTFRGDHTRSTRPGCWRRTATTRTPRASRRSPRRSTPPFRPDDAVPARSDETQRGRGSATIPADRLAPSSRVPP